MNNCNDKILKPVSKKQINIKYRSNGNNDKILIQMIIMLK